MAECGASEGEDRRADVGIRDDLDTEDVGEAGAAVGSEGAKDEVFAFLVEDQDAGYHDAWIVEIWDIVSRLKGRVDVLTTTAGREVAELKVHC
jgi:hypothetical protein